MEVLEQLGFISAVVSQMIALQFLGVLCIMLACALVVGVEVVHERAMRGLERAVNSRD